MIILSHLKKIKVAEKTLPEYQLQTIDDNNFSLVKTKNLLLIQVIKQKIQTPLSKLKTLFKVKIKLKRSPRVLESKQSPFLKPYIERNTELQKESEKDFNKVKKQNDKSTNKALFGKPIKNLKINVKIVNTRKQCLKWLFRPTFKKLKNNFVTDQKP